MERRWELTSGCQLSRRGVAAFSQRLGWPVSLALSLVDHAALSQVTLCSMVTRSHGMQDHPCARRKIRISVS